MNDAADIGLRWTIGNVSDSGFEALRLSIWGAWKLFGRAAAYAVCVNSLPVDRARALTGEVPVKVRWQAVTAGDIPSFLRAHLDGAMAEGVGWKFAPLRLFPRRYELALDNDCILWELPEAIRRGRETSACVFAAGVKGCLGQFAVFCGDQPFNSGIRGLPPGFDFEAALRGLLERHPVMLQSELDEQGLQAAAVAVDGPPLVVSVEDVSICSPFPPHSPRFGLCGAHFVGLNARQLPWTYENRPAVEYIQQHWRRHRAALYRNLGLPFPEASPCVRSR